jgi:hypothetical protein
MFTQMPYLVAELLSLPEAVKYTSHSFRRTAATSAANAGTTSDQMFDFFGALRLLNGPVAPTPQKYFPPHPIVQVHKIKTHNFYEIKVDF